jgi:hypothetical protein
VVYGYVVPLPSEADSNELPASSECLATTGEAKYGHSVSQKYPSNRTNLLTIKLYTKPDQGPAACTAVNSQQILADINSNF